LRRRDLQHIIEQFEVDEKAFSKEGIFGIYIQDPSSMESILRANKAGLQIFALELLKAARDLEDTLDFSEENVIPLDVNADWIDENSDTFIGYIELLAGKQKLKPKKEYKETLRDKLIPFGCGIALIVLAIATVVGLVTIIQFLF
jgi:hypothetical protein